MVYLEITLDVAAPNRAAAAVYARFKEPFLSQVKGAQSKQLLVRDEDVQVLHGFDTTDHPNAYLATDPFTQDVVGALKPLLRGEPDVRIYQVA
jgi:hypothetical protein